MMMPLTRREWLGRMGMGFGAVGLTDLLHRQGQLLATPTPTSPLAPRSPMMQRYAGRQLPRENLRTEHRTGATGRRVRAGRGDGSGLGAVSEALMWANQLVFVR